LGPPLLFALAGALELSLRNALASEKYAPKIKSDFLGGVRSGVNGTPLFFINGHQHEGSYAFEDLVAAIEQHLHAKASL
jgi:protein-disulfide isomerase